MKSALYSSLILLFTSILLNIYFIHKYLYRQTEYSTTKDINQESTQFPLVSKRSFIDTPSDIILNFIQLRSQLNTYVATIPEVFGIYFEYLPSGASIGIHEKEDIRLASLGKVSTVMAIYKRVATGKNTLTQPILLEDKHINMEFGSIWKMGAGTTMPLADVIQKTLIESDNTGHNMLLSLLQGDELSAVFDSFDIPEEKLGVYPAISAKNYSSILRSLYLSAYLPPKYSNEILNIMTKTVYTDKLPAGVDSNIPVAHKIGVVESVDPKKSSYSDCGIVYVPKRPYILCMLVSNTSNEMARQYMSTISNMVYMYVKNVKSLY